MTMPIFQSMMQNNHAIAHKLLSEIQQNPDPAKVNQVIQNLMQEAQLQRVAPPQS